LIKSIIFTLQLYYLSFIKIPKSTCKKIKKLQRTFYRVGVKDREKKFPESNGKKSKNKKEEYIKF